MKDIDAQFVIAPLERQIWKACESAGIDPFHIRVSGAVSLAHRNNGKTMTVNIVHTSYDSVSHPVNRSEAKQAVQKILADNGINAAVRITTASGARL